MSSKSHKLLMESWRKFLNEEEGKDPQHERTLKNLLNKKYTAFVSGLEKAIKDPKFARFLNMGLEPDDGDSQDDTIVVKKANIPVQNLQPTQSQIGLADSLGWTSKNKPKQAGVTAKLQSGSPADVGGRIITANGKNFNVSENMPAEDRGKAALKLAHIAIAAVDKGVPLQPADAATDVYATRGDKQKIRSVLDNDRVIGDEMAKALMDAYGVSTRDEVVDKIAENAISLYDETKAAASTGPERGKMPQTGGTDSFGDTDPLDKMKAMRAGSVNWKTPAGEE